MTMDKPIWGQDMWQDIWGRLQELEADLPVFHVPTHEGLTRPPPPPKQLASWGPSLGRALTTESSVDTAGWAHRKSGHRDVQGRRQIDMNAGLFLEYRDVVNVGKA